MCYYHANSTIREIIKLIQHCIKAACLRDISIIRWLQPRVQENARNCTYFAKNIELRTKEDNACSFGILHSSHSLYLLTSSWLFTGNSIWVVVMCQILLYIFNYERRERLYLSGKNVIAQKRSGQRSRIKIRDNSTHICSRKRRMHPPSNSAVRTTRENKNKVELKAHSYDRSHLPHRSSHDGNSLNNLTYTHTRAHAHPQKLAAPTENQLFIRNRKYKRNKKILTVAHALTRVTYYYWYILSVSESYRLTNQNK